MREILYRATFALGVLLLIPSPAAVADISAVGATHADSELSRFIKTVVESNPRVQAARSALNASSSFKDAASRPLYNPLLTLNAQNSDVETRNLGIGQTIDWAGKREARTAVAESDRLVVEAEYLATRWAVTVELLDGLAQHQTGVDREALAESRRRLMQDFANLAQRRFDAGDLNQVELSLANLASSAARIQKATAGAGLAEARQAVRSVIPRVPAAQWPELPLRMPELPKTASDLQTLVLELPEVVAARRQVESADAVVELRERERRPDPTITVSGGREGGEDLIGVNVTVPLFVRNRFNNEVSAAIAQRSQMQQVADDLTQRAHARLVSAAERYQLARGAWGDWQLTGQASLNNQTEQLQKLWEAGEVSTTDYLVQLSQTLNVQEQALDLRQALWRAWFEWLWASGMVDEWLGQGANR